jgi:hypothetical protein
VAAGLDRREDLAGEGPAELGVAELVDEPPGAGSSPMRAIAVPACTSRRSPGATGPTSIVSISVASPVSSCPVASSRAPSAAMTRTSTATSPQVMQCSSVHASPGSLIRSRSP